ncbi:MAG: hypothetical protein U0625_12665 [Phycisphaerales bacterium]
MSVAYILIPAAIAGVVVEWQVYRRAKAGVAATVQAWTALAMSGAFAVEAKDLAAQRLESEIHASFWYALLRRITGLAPLLGVIVTAASLTFTNIGGLEAAGESGGLAALAALRPVFWGVVVGAALSITNQLLVVHFESVLRGQVLEAVDRVPSERFAGIRDILGTFPAELRQIHAALEDSHRSMQVIQSEIIRQMEELLTTVSNSLAGLADTATSSGEILRESATNHFDQVKLTTREFGQTIGELSDLIAQSNQHWSGALQSAASHLGDAQRSLSKSLGEIQAETARGVGRLERQSEALQQSTEATLAAMRAGIDASLQMHQRALQESLAARSQEASAVATETGTLVRSAIADSARSMGAAADGLAAATGQLGQISVSLARLEAQIQRAGEQSTASSVATANLSHEISLMGSRMKVLLDTLQPVVESIAKRELDASKPSWWRFRGG